MLFRSSLEQWRKENLTAHELRQAAELEADRAADALRLAGARAAASAALARMQIHAG